MTRTTQETIDQFSQFTPCIKLGADSGTLLVVAPELGARILAVSTSGMTGKNLLWTNPAVKNVADNWNFGGARTWIAPEDKFYLDSANNWFVPKQMDPGHFELKTQTKTQVTCVNEFTVRNKDQVEYHAKITRKIKTISAEFELPDSVRFAGFEFTHSLQNLGDFTWGEGMDFMGLWSLLQINPGGTLLVPLKPGVTAAYRNYFNIFTDSHLKATASLLCVKIDGKFRGKLGISPKAARNMLCYLCAQGAQSYMIVKQFEVDPSGNYLDHPWGQPAEYGDPVQLYNDDGQMGGFGEMECHAPAKKLKSQEQQHFPAKVQFFTGPQNTLIEVADQHFKIPLDAACIF